MNCNICTRYNLGRYCLIAGGKLDHLSITPYVSLALGLFRSWKKKQGLHFCLEKLHPLHIKVNDMNSIQSTPVEIFAAV